MTSLQNLQSEKLTVQQFLDNTPTDSLIERYSWLSRLQSLDAQIEAEQKRVVPARSAITFRGPAVFGSYGIASTFGLAATRAYTNIVQQLAAQWERAQPLPARGSVPNAKKFDLLVTGTALGSFGFDLEEAVDEQLSLEERSVVARSIEKTNEVLQSTLQSDEELTEATAGIDARALDKVRVFLKVLSDNDATCTIQSDEREFRFDSIEQVTRARVRLATQNIVSEEVWLEGVFEGLLPTPRTFEFRRADTGEVVVGKIYPEVADIADINRHLGQSARVRALSHRVGNAKPRFVLIQNPEWQRSQPMA